MNAATNHRTKNEPDGSMTEWESYDGGKSWWMVGQTYPHRPTAAAYAQPYRDEFPETCWRTLDEPGLVCILERGHDDGIHELDDVRDPLCVERWPECESGAYDPRCCRFPKSCSCNVLPGREHAS